LNAGNEAARWAARNTGIGAKHAANAIGSIGVIAELAGEFMEGWNSIPTPPKKEKKESEPVMADSAPGLDEAQVA
jgi:hypothetical protein